ncbi:DUF4238 domain-containing protein [Rhodococcus sp. 14-1411-2a]|uniref:DUF4238 domain-containing protein n=1 Tax=Rhodococcus sp. 14-1411-2a TaxID=2023151 RepID=UPI0015C60815|nr:DUF4238 domain-containing protein [Rhodococcus sp. 14-1411-2a]
MPTIVRNQHTVPRFYLNKFANAQKQIGVVKLPGLIRMTRSTKSTTVARDFYNVEHDTQPVDFFEREFGRIEDATAKIFQKIEVDRTWPLNHEDRNVLATFIALQNLRGPSQRNHLGQLSTAMNRLYIAAAGRDNFAESARTRGIDDLTENEADALWRLATQPGIAPTDATALAHMQQLTELLPATIKYIRGRPWTLIRFQTKTLLTCDTPVSLIPHPRADPNLGVGLKNAWGITFPLTRRIGLLMGNPEPMIEAEVAVEHVWAGTLDAVLSPSTRWARLFNDATISNARHHVLHHPDDAHVVPDDLPQPNEVEVDTSGVEELIGTVQAMAHLRRARTPASTRDAGDDRQPAS